MSIRAENLAAYANRFSGYTELRLQRNVNSRIALLNGDVVATTLAGLTSGQLRTPLNRTEWNEDRRTPVWTATNASGLSQPESCMGWTSRASNMSAVGGDSDSVGSDWTAAVDGQLSCASQAALYCFQDNASQCPEGCTAPLQCISGECGLYAFVTSQTRRGNLGGLAGADNICSSAAKSAAVPSRISR